MARDQPERLDRDYRAKHSRCSRHDRPSAASPAARMFRPPDTTGVQDGTAPRQLEPPRTNCRPRWRSSVRPRFMPQHAVHLNLTARRKSEGVVKLRAKERQFVEELRRHGRNNAADWNFVRLRLARVRSQNARKSLSCLSHRSRMWHVRSRLASRQRRARQRQPPIGRAGSAVRRGWCGGFGIRISLSASSHCERQIRNHTGIMDFQCPFESEVRERGRGSKDANFRFGRRGAVETEFIEHGLESTARTRLLKMAQIRQRDSTLEPS